VIITESEFNKLDINYWSGNDGRWMLIGDTSDI
jgi:hypothetical protein